EHAADRLGVADDPEAAADLAHLAVELDEERDPVGAQVRDARHIDPDLAGAGPDHLVEPVGEIGRPGRVEAAYEDNFGDVPGVADLAIHENPSLPSGRQDVVGLPEPVGRDPDTVTSCRVEIDRAANFRRGAEGYRGRVSTPDHLSRQEAGLPAVLGE